MIDCAPGQSPEIRFLENVTIKIRFAKKSRLVSSLASQRREISSKNCSTCTSITKNNVRNLLKRDTSKRPCIMNNNVATYFPQLGTRIIFFLLTPTLSIFGPLSFANALAPIRLLFGHSPNTFNYRPDILIFTNKQKDLLKTFKI